ncbi:MAG: PAS domain S-box protein [Nitrospirae bacterium YQR-1]
MEKEMKAIFEQAPIGIAVIESATGRFVSINPAYCNIVGYTEKEMLSKTFQDITHPDDIQPDTYNMKRLISGEISMFTMEKRYKTKDNYVVWVNLKCVPLWMSGEKPVYHLAMVEDITKQKVLLDERERFFNESPNLICIASADGYFTQVNLMFEKVLGYTKEEIYAKPFVEFIHPDDRQATVLEVEKQLNGLITETFDNRYICKDGSYKILSWLAGPVLENGRIYAIARDVTEQRKLEEELYLQGEIIANIEEGATIINVSDGTIVYANPKFNAMFGYNENELTGRNVSLINAPTEVSPEDKAKQIMSILNETGYWKGEILNIKKDGTLFWCHATVSTFQHKRYGTVWITIHQDITKRKELEKKLLEEKKFSESVINTLPGLFYLFDNTGKFILWNKNLETVSGYCYEEIAKMTPLDFFTGQDRDTINTAIAAVFKTGIAFVDAGLHTKDGRDIPYCFTGLLIKIDGKNCLTGVGTDITERKAMETQLRQLTLDLEKRVDEEVEKNRAKDQLMYEHSRHIAMGELLVNIAHHWRQPLTTIGLLVQDIGDSWRYNELNEEYLNKNIESVMSALTALSKTIDNFRNYYTNDPQKKELNITEAIDNTLSLLEGYFIQKGFVIDKQFDSELTVDLFPNEFAQVILNILTNIRDVFEQKQITDGIVRIRAFVESVTKKIVITIADNGGGVPEDIISRIFDPYFTTKDKDGGTGLGLYIAKVITEKNMKGTLSVRNSGRWCEFRIEI